MTKDKKCYLILDWLPEQGKSKRRVFYGEIRKSGKAALVIVAADASDNTKKKVYKYVYLL